MTSPAATTAIFVLFDATASSAIVILFTFEIARMTACAERRIARRGIGDDLAIAPVTRYTRHPCIMVTRVVDGLMREADRRPAACRMTGVAVLRSVEMNL